MQKRNQVNLELSHVVLWKGDLRSAWEGRGFNYDTFRIIVKLRGSRTRRRILHELTLPKNRLELSTILKMDWRSIDAHIEVLTAHGLVEELALVGTSKYYIISQKSIKLRRLLEEIQNLAN